MITVEDGKSLHNELELVVMALQYSVPYCIAVALVDDVDDPLAFGERALRNPQVHALAGKITCESWPDAPSGWASEVHVALRDGRTLERANDDFPGTPARSRAPSRYSNSSKRLRARRTSRPCSSSVRAFATL